MFGEMVVCRVYNLKCMQEQRDEDRDRERKMT